MLRYWWARLNEEVFHGELHPCGLEVGSCADFNAVGLCYPLDCGRVRLVLDPGLSTRAAVLATLAHEMIHQWQHQSGEPLTHGDVFRSWGALVYALTGLTV